MGAGSVTFHVEAAHAPIRLAREIRHQGARGLYKGTLYGVDVFTSSHCDTSDAGANCRGIPSAQCIAVGDGYPMGQCTRACTMDAQCGAGGICLDFGTRRVCFKRCEDVTGCCAGYNCFVGRGEGDAAERACFPFCTGETRVAPDVVPGATAARSSALSGSSAAIGPSRGTRIGTSSSCWR